MIEANIRIIHLIGVWPAMSLEPNASSEQGNVVLNLPESKSDFHKMPSHDNGGHENSFQEMQNAPTNAYLAAILVSLDMLGRNACDTWESKASGYGHYNECKKRSS